MLKKVFSLLFVFTIFLSGASFAAADIKSLGSMIKNNPAKASSGIQNEVYFAHDYSEIVTDVCKNFANDITALAVSLHAAPRAQSFQQHEHGRTFDVEFILPNFYEKTVFAQASFAGTKKIEAGNNSAAAFLFLILAFILLYIGLLRLFDADSFFSYKIRV